MSSKKLVRRSRGEAAIPSASMSDIAFLLLLFFMVTTTVTGEKGLRLDVPRAEATQRIRLRSNVLSVWVDKSNRISIQDNLVKTNDEFAARIARRLKEKPDLVVLLRVDKDARYALVSDLIEKMKEVQALKLTFATNWKEG
jgi:biopolymer transport protein ExbD